MNWLALTLLAITVITICAWSAAFLLVRGRIRRRHRVDPTVATSAPTSWLVDPRAPARLHRRIAKAGQVAGTVIDEHRPTGRRARKAEPPTIVALATDLRGHAVALDQRLARAAVLAPQARRAHVAAIAGEVASLETAAAALVQLDLDLRRPVRLPTDPEPAVDLEERTARLAAALRELDELDASAGLRPGVAAPRLAQG